MATTVDQLIVEIKAETAGLRKGLDDVNKKLGFANKTAKSSILNFGNLTKVLAGVGLIQFGRSVVSTTRTFEDLNATLRAITGSAEAADKAFAIIRQFTATTTFQLENVTEGFITLLNAGINPSVENLTAFGNVAAAFNRDITQVTRAIFNATTGEMEMLKQFGIKAKQNQDTIDVTFDGVTQTIEKSADSIVNFVADIGKIKFPTALEERAMTLSGAISNMQDSMSEFFFAVGEGGFKDVLRDLALSTKAMLDEMRPLARTVGRGTAVAFEKLKDAFVLVSENLNKIIAGVVVFTALNLTRTAITAGVAVVKLARAMGALRIAMLALNKVSKGNIIVLIGIIAAEQAGLLDEAAERVGNVLEKLGDKLTDFFGLDEAGGAGEDINKLEKEFQELLKAVDDGTASVQQLDAVLKLAEGSAAQLGLVYKALDSAIANGQISQEQATAKLREFLETTGPMGKAMAQIGSEVEGLASSFSDDLTNSLMEGESALESFRNFAQNVVQAVISAFMEMLVIQPIVDAILGAFNISAPKGKVTGGGGKAPSAGGGSLSVNQPVLVGERGPELFIPNANGTLLNNMNTKNAMVGGSPIIVNQSINFATGVVPTVRAEVTRMLPQIADVTKGAVLESAMRGGSFARGLRRG